MCFSAINVSAVYAKIAMEEFSSIILLLSLTIS